MKFVRVHSWMVPLTFFLPSIDYKLTRDMKSGTSLAIELKRGLFKNGNTSSSMSASIRTLLLVVCDTSPTTSSYPIESASSPLVCFG
jgi:hypothetical protein